MLTSDEDSNDNDDDDDDEDDINKIDLNTCALGWELRFEIPISEGGNRKQNSRIPGIPFFFAENKLEGFSK